MNPDGKTYKALYEDFKKWADAHEWFRFSDTPKDSLHWGHDYIEFVLPNGTVVAVFVKDDKVVHIEGVNNRDTF